MRNARLLELLQGAVQRGTFMLSDRKISDWYLDCRPVLLSPEGSMLATDALTWEVMLNRELKAPRPTAVVGPAVAACPLVTGFGLKAASINWWDLKLCYIRKEPKVHGTGRLIEGARLDSSDLVAVVDDVATSGRSLMHAVEAVRKTGATVDTAYCLVDRDEGASRYLADNGVELISIFNAQDVLG